MDNDNYEQPVVGEKLLNDLRAGTVTDADSKQIDKKYRTGMKALNDVQKAEMLRRYKAGESGGAIGRDYNITEGTIYAWFARQGIRKLGVKKYVKVKTETDKQQLDNIFVVKLGNIVIHIENDGTQVSGVVTDEDLLTIKVTKV